MGVSDLINSHLVAREFRLDELEPQRFFWLEVRGACGAGSHRGDIKGDGGGSRVVTVERLEAVSGGDDEPEGEEEEAKERH